MLLTAETLAVLKVGGSQAEVKQGTCVVCVEISPVGQFVIL